MSQVTRHRCSRERDSLAGSEAQNLFVPWCYVHVTGRRRRKGTKSTHFPVDWGRGLETDTKLGGRGCELICSAHSHSALPLCVCVCLLVLVRFMKITDKNIQFNIPLKGTSVFSHTQKNVSIRMFSNYDQRFYTLDAGMLGISQCAL